MTSKQRFICTVCFLWGLIHVVKSINRFWEVGQDNNFVLYFLLLHREQRNWCREYCKLPQRKGLSKTYIILNVNETFSGLHSVFVRDEHLYCPWWRFGFIQKSKCQSIFAEDSSQENPFWCPWANLPLYKWTVFNVQIVKDKTSLVRPINFVAVIVDWYYFASNTDND